MDETNGKIESTNSQLNSKIDENNQNIEESNKKWINDVNNIIEQTNKYTAILKTALCSASKAL